MTRSAVLALAACALAACHLADFRTRAELADVLGGGDGADAVAPPDVPADAVADTGCGEGQALCGAVCVNVQSDTMNCGACGAMCPAGGATGTTICAAGRCALSCERGLGDCDSNLATGCETDIDSDAENCGGCGRQCPPDPDGVATCSGSMCRLQCNQGFALVSGHCARTAPRQLWPPSGATVTTQRPTFVVEPIAGASVQIEVCLDAGCSLPRTVAESAGATATPTDPLPAGVLFWRTRGAVGGAPSMQTSALWSFRVLPHAPASAPAGVADTAWGVALDVNNDGVADAAIGAPDTGASNAGRVRLSLGAAGTGPQPPMAIEPPAASAGHFGRAVAAAGDVNGDGFGDLAVASDGDVWIYYGNATGVAAAPARLARPVGADAASFGRVIVAAGDVNRDGYGDLAVAAPSAMGTMPAASGSGRVYVYRGARDGIATTASVQLFGGATDATGRAFGASMAGACDINNDRFSDLIVGQPSAAGGPSPAAFVYVGSADGSFADAPSAITPSPPLLDFGGAAGCVGDTNGDGRVDFVVASPTQQRVFVYPGGVSVSTRIAELLAPAGASRFGTAVVSAGQLDGDELCDIAVGAPGTASTSPGQVALFLGSTTVGGTRTAAGSLLGAGPAGDAFGGALAPAEDLDGDGALDLLVAASYAELAPAMAGRAFWFRGLAGGMFETTGRLIAAPAGDVGFGASLARLHRRAQPLPRSGAGLPRAACRVGSARHRRPMVVRLPPP